MKSVMNTFLTIGLIEVVGLFITFLVSFDIGLWLLGIAVGSAIFMFYYMDAIIFYEEVKNE